jgi:peptidoglycan/LPS O-acetylase OafA/YrhL
MIPGLDGLRAVAYLLVFFFHAYYFELGWIGVQFFFVLSGFLITGILLDMKKSLPAGWYFIKFYGRRFLRIFPLYYFYLLLMGGLVTWLVSIPYRPGNLKAFEEQARYAYFYVYNFLFTTVFHKPVYLLEHLWSLSVEEQFYIFWPLLIFFVPERLQKKLFLAFIALGPVFRVAFYFIHASGEFRIFRPNVEEALYPLPFTHIDSFAFGAYLSRYSIPKAKEQFFILLGLIPLVGFTTQYLATGQLGKLSAFGYPLLMPDGFKFIWGYSLLNYFFAVTIQAVARQGMFNRFLEWSPMRYLGKISYGLYVFHQPVLWFAFDIERLGLEQSIAQPIGTVLAFIGTLLIGSISYRFMEKPLLNLKDRLFPIRPENAR